MKINFETDDNSRFAYNLLRYYWLNNSGDFAAKVVDLRHEYQLGLAEFNSFISSARSHIDFGQCNACKKPNLKVVKNRSEARDVFENLYYHYFCEECRVKAEKHCREQNEYSTKIVWMRLSFKYKLWNKLEKEELNFLKSIILLNDWNRLYHEIIASDLSKYLKILSKLNGMNLIYYRKEEDSKNKIKVIKVLQDIVKQKLI